MWRPNRQPGCRVGSGTYHHYARLLPRRCITSRISRLAPAVGEFCTGGSAHWERPYPISNDKACIHAVSARRERNVRYELQSMIGCDAGSAFHRPVMYPAASARK